ncbi:hypothetical protein Hanom_Chr17g01576221 [Helianthus anomalus]
MKMTLDDFLKQSEDAKADKAAKDVAKEAETSAKNVEAESIKEKEVEGVVECDSSETEPEYDTSMLGIGKIKLKLKPQKKKKGSDEEDATYIATLEEKKKVNRKRRAISTSVIPRSVRARKGATTMPEIQSVKALEVEKHVESTSIPDVEKDQNAEKPEVESKKAPESSIFERVEKNDEDEVEFMGERPSTPPPPPANPTIHIPDDPKEPSSAKKATTLSSSQGFPTFPDNLGPGPISLDDVGDLFNEGKINLLTKRVSLLEKAKAKEEAERDDLKAKLKAVKAENVELKKVVIDQITEEFVEENAKYETMNETNKTLHQMIGELHESSSNENKILRQEIEALREDKAVKDEQLNMFYTVMEYKLGIYVQVVYNELEIERVEARRVQREKELAKEATQKKKGLVIDKEEILGSSSQQVQPETEGTIDSNPLAVVVVGDVIDVTPEEIKLDRRKTIEKRHKEEEEKLKDEELEQLFDDIDNYDPMNDNDDDDDDDQGATGLIVEDQQHEASSSGKQHASDQEPRTRESMLEELGMDDGHMKFDIEDEIPPSPEREYTFNFSNEADNFKDVIIEDVSNISDKDTPFHYLSVDDNFPTFSEMFKTHNEDEVRRKVVESISIEGIPEVVPQEELLEGRKSWFKVMPKERKYKRPLQYFTDHPDKSLGDILSWGYLEDLQVYAIRREHGEKNKFPDLKPHFPKQVIKIDPDTGEKDITLKIKPPICLKNMALRAMEQDFNEDFQGWLYNQSTTEAVISLYDKKTGESRRINVLDPMWLVNYSKKDINCLFSNKIVYDFPDRAQAQQYQKMVNLCFTKDINSEK